jgi:glucose/arabinose dehydrogenase
MTAIYDELILGHQALQKEEQAEPTPERIERVRAFIADVVAAGAAIADARQREQLRSLLRYWSAWVYDRTKEYPQSQLMPPLPAVVAAEEGRTKALGWVRQNPALAMLVGLGALVGVVVLIVVLSVGILRLAASPPPTPTPVVALTVLPTESKIPAVRTRTRVTADTSTELAAGGASTDVPPTETKPPTDQSPTAGVTRPSPTPAVGKGTPTLAPPSMQPTTTLVVTPTKGPSPTPTATQPPRQLFTFEPKAGAVFGSAFSPDGRLLAAGGANGLVTLWDVSGAAPVEVAHLKASASVLAVQFSPDGAYVVAGLMDYSAQAWPIAYAVTSTLQVGQVIDLAGHTASVSSVAFSPDGTLLVTGSVDGTLKWWDLAIRSQVRASSLLYTGSVVSVVFSPDGQLLIYGGTTPEIFVWSLAQKKVVAKLTGAGQAGRSLAFSADGRWLAAGSYDGTVRLWQRASAESVDFAPVASVVEGKAAGYAVAFSADGLLATAKEDGTISLWQVKPGGAALVAALAGQHKGPVRSLAFSPDGRLLVSGGSDQKVVVWAVR